MLYVSVGYFIFFFFKQKTAYEMRISDWSSDVCSSYLPWWWVAEGARLCAYDAAATAALGAASVPIADVRGALDAGQRAMLDALGQVLADSTAAQIGRASCRDRVCQYV